MERDVYDVLGGMHPAKILPIDVIAAVRPIAKRGAMDTAKRVVGMIGQVMRHGVVLGLCPADPTIGLAAALGDAPPPRHRPALIDPAAVGAFQRAVAAVETPTIAKPLLQMIALTAQRPGEVRRMEWSQVDAARKEWTFDVTKTATAAHIVPLSQPALDLLDAMRARTGRGRYVFASGTDRPVSDVAASQFIRRLRYGDRMSAHGWRATFRTVAVETLGHPEAIVEMHIAHAVRDAHGRAYNRTQWHAERHVLVGDWARWLADAERKALDLSASLR